LQTLKTHLSEVWSVAFSPDGKFIATSGTDFRVFLFAASELLQPSSFAFPMGFGSVWGGAISPDRSKVLLPLPGRLQDPEFTQTIWDVASNGRSPNFDKCSLCRLFLT